MNNSTLFLFVGFQQQQKSETGKGFPLTPTLAAEMFGAGEF